MTQNLLRRIAIASAVAGLILQAGCHDRAATSAVNSSGQPGLAATAQPASPVLALIREEGMNRSQVMSTLDYLCNVIGPRLTVSPNAQTASKWSRDTLEKWGLENAHLEAWGPFGRGWSVKRFSLQVIEPQSITLAAYPKAWSPGFDGPMEAPVIHVDAVRESELEAYKGKLKGAIVLLGPTRTPEARFQPLATRLTDEELAKLAGLGTGTSALLGQRTDTPSERRAQFAAAGRVGEALVGPRANQTPPPSPASQPAGANAGGNAGGRRANFFFAQRLLNFAHDEGALLVLTPSTMGDGGTFFVQQASIPEPTGAASAAVLRPRVWTLPPNNPSIPPQVTVGVEDYNRVARMLARGVPVKMNADLQVQFHDGDGLSYNTIAELPGTDLKDEIVMVGAHLDSWHSGTGATDNAVGSAAAMEAVRILKASGIKPRRTIRVALWTGEEQGIFGSEAYVRQHFGYDANRPAPNYLMSTSQPSSRPASGPRNFVKLPDHEKLSVYFNLDNGTGKIRGVYAQGNTAAVPYFRKWLVPFAADGASTVTLSNTGSTDHIPFDAVGLPGFQFIQDSIEYGSRTHHSNQDVYDRIQEADMKQASTIIAAFLYHAAMMDERFPRKP